jgi:hypothetical protein
MSDIAKTVSIAAGLVLALSAFATPALASCKNQICVHGSDDFTNRLHTVDVSAQRPGYDVFYVMLPDPASRRAVVGPTKLVVPRFQFPMKPGLRYSFAVKACSRASGACIGWTEFRHQVTAAW